MYLFFLMAILSWVAHAEPYYNLTNTLKERGQEFRLKADYWKSSGRWDYDGKKDPFASGEGFSFGQGELSGYYGLTSRIQIGFGLRGRSVMATVTSTSVTPNETINLKQSGLESVFSHIKISSPEWKGAQLAAEGYYRTVTYSNPKYNSLKPNDFIVLGEGSSEVAGGVGLSKTFKNGSQISARTMYRHPGRDLGPEMLSHFEGALVGKNFALIAGAEIVSSLKKDQYTDDPRLKPAIGTGSSYFFNSVNRSWTAPYVGLNIAFNEKWRLESRAMSFVSGVSTDKMNVFSIILAYRNENKKVENKIRDDDFKDYSIEGEVTKVSEDEKLALVNIGLSEGVENGMRFDFFKDDYKGGNVLIASGYVVKVGADTSALKITERIRPDLKLEKGLIVRGGK